MESFVDPHTKKPVVQLQLAQGETAVVRLNKFDMGVADTEHPGLYKNPKVIVTCANPAVAFCYQVTKLAKSKREYDNHYNVTRLRSEATVDPSNIVETAALELDGAYYFQVCGQSAGTTELIAAQGPTAYATSIPVTVKDNPKQLLFNPRVPFATLWQKHPLIDPSFIGSRNSPCTSMGHFQCMVRFCRALSASGIRLDDKNGFKCGDARPEHKNHFTFPYDFLKWFGADHYEWTAKPPYQPEPMPGLAAWRFMIGRRGVVLFKNYFPMNGAMSGGHIDLWNEMRMGNNATAERPLEGEGLAAFFRSQSIYFWPVP